MEGGVNPEESDSRHCFVAVTLDQTLEEWEGAWLSDKQGNCVSDDGNSECKRLEGMERVCCV